ncbi:MAG: sel1 repeat family protein [Kiritimatiellae bacterium]|nr:sel1 repeat family protein [Kiritimatiellia bacterium]
MRTGTAILAAALAAALAAGCRTGKVDMMKDAAADGDAAAQTWLGEAYGYGKEGVEVDRTEAAKWLRMAAEQDYAPAMANLGECYRMGEGVDKNTAEAVKWYRRGAELGDAKAQYFLGGSYAAGFGVEVDRKEAAKWWRKAAANGDRQALETLYKLRIPLKEPSAEKAD